MKLAGYVVALWFDVGPWYFLPPAVILKAQLSTQSLAQVPLVSFCFPHLSGMKFYVKDSLYSENFTQGLSSPYSDETLKSSYLVKS